MELFYKIALALHILAGGLALAVFWIPLVAKKGGTLHRRVGWVYVAAAGTIALTGLVVCARLVESPNPMRQRAGIFLSYVGVLAAASAIQGVRALQTKKRAEPSRALIDLAPAALLIGGGIALAAFGVREGMVLYLFFAALGTVQGAARLRYWLTPPATKREWFIAHMSGMGTSCITTITAFFVVNAPRLGLRTFSLVLWVVPPLVSGIGLTIWTRYYRRRFDRDARPLGLRGAEG